MVPRAAEIAVMTPICPYSTGSRTRAYSGSRRNAIVRCAIEAAANAAVPRTRRARPLSARTSGVDALTARESCGFTVAPHPVSQPPVCGRTEHPLEACACQVAQSASRSQCQPPRTHRRRRAQPRQVPNQLVAAARWHIPCRGAEGATEDRPGLLVASDEFESRPGHRVDECA